MKSEHLVFLSILPLFTVCRAGVVAVVAVLAFATNGFAVLPDNLSIDVGDIDGDRQNEVLVLTKRSVRSATNYQVMTWDSVNGYQNYASPEVRTYRGYVQDDPDMRVNANVEAGDILNANLSDGRNINIRLTTQTVTVNGPEGTFDPGNGNTVIPLAVNRTSPTPKGFIIPRYTMRRIQVAADVWNDYYIAIGSDVNAAVARVEQRINDSEFFYARDMGMAWELTTVVVRLEDLTTEWKDEWNNVLRPAGAVFNSAIQYKLPGGGVTSGSIFSASNPDHHVFGKVGTISAYSRALGHEVGHVFKAGHRSSWNDIMDSSGSCLGTGTVERMIDHSHIALEAAAPAIVYGAPLPPFAMEDGANTQQDMPVDIDLLENDYDGNGDAISLESVDAVAVRGGTVTVLSGGMVRYTPPAGFLGMDEFGYAVSDSGGITNRHGYAKVYVRNEDLVTRIRFDETSGGVAADTGVYGADGILTEGLSFANSGPGRIGTALERLATDPTRASADFPGVGDPMEGSLSVSLWVKYATVPMEDGVLLCKGGATAPDRFRNPRGGWAIGHVGGTGFRFAGNMQRDLWQNSERFDRLSNTAIVADTWYHLVMVIDRPNQVIRGWVDNVEVTNSAWTSFVPDGLINSSHSPLVVFNSKGNQQAGDWNGPASIDDVRIFSKALNASDVAVLFVAEDDVDTDGILDYWELENFGDLGTADAASNQDGDSHSDVAEFLAGTGPEDASDFLHIESFVKSAGGAEISWRSVEGKQYGIDHLQTLGSGSWAPVASGLAGEEGTTSWLDTDVGRTILSRGFYRVFVESD